MALAVFSSFTTFLKGKAMKTLKQVFGYFNYVASAWLLLVTITAQVCWFQGSPIPSWIFLNAVDPQPMDVSFLGHLSTTVVVGLAAAGTFIIGLKLTMKDRT